MRLVLVSGFNGSGKTSLIKAAGNGHDFCFIANNKGSAEQLSGICRNTDDFPFKSPCARIRQFKFRVDLMRENDPKMMVCEPPGNCMETSSPMLNPIYVSDKGVIDIGPLITVFDGRTLKKGISKRTTDGLRSYNMIDESDVIAVSFSDELSDEERASIQGIVSGINEDAKVIFYSEKNGEGVKELSEQIFGDAKYSRPLFY